VAIKNLRRKKIDPDVAVRDLTSQGQ